MAQRLPLLEFINSVKLGQVLEYSMQLVLTLTLLNLISFRFFKYLRREPYRIIVFDYAPDFLTKCVLILYPRDLILVRSVC